MDIPILEAKGRNGDLELYEDKVTIRRSGVTAFVLGGDKDILLSQVTSIQYKKPGIFTNGHIQFLGVNGNDAQNTIIFTAKEQPAFEKIKQAIEQKITGFNKQREADMEEYMTSLKEGKTSIKFRIEGGSSQVILKENEELQMVLPNISLWEPRKVTTTTGGYGGPSFRVAKGVYFRVGAFGAQSQSHDELKELDRGRLTLTNKRLLFTGAKRTDEYNLAKIISIEPYSDGIAVRTSGRSKVQYFIGIDPKQISTTVTINERNYSEPFSGLMLKYTVEGLIKRQE